MRRAMKGLWWLSLLLLWIGPVVLLSARDACAQEAAWNADPRVGNFYESLRPYGEWIWHPTYGWVWSPYDMPYDWQPYTHGHWEYTDWGWTWVSDYPWGWACFHYGRWFYDDSYGWLWYPDTVWAPCWVAWRTGDDWIGWAPLPPAAVWRAGVGLDFSEFDADDFIPRHAFSFCHRRDFIDGDLDRRIENRDHNVSIFRTTRVTSNTLREERGRVVNQVPFQGQIEKALGRPVPRRRIVEADSPFHHGVSGNEVKVFRPEQRAVPRAVPQAREAPVIPELSSRHDSETRALQEIQLQRQRTLEAEHARELSNPPSGVNRQELAERHQAETNAFRDEMERERRLVQNWHGREETMATVPQAPQQRHITVTLSRPAQAEDRQANARAGGDGGRSGNEDRHDEGRR